MADESHLEILREGVDTWNRWRRDHPEIRPDLEKAPLNGIDLSNANLMRVNLRGANLDSANLSKALLIGAELNVADLSKATLIGANLCGADLHKANLSDANLSGAYMRWTHLAEVNFERAELNGANLSGASLVETNVTDATFTDCSVYGISAWNLVGEPKEQLNLHISRTEWPHSEQAFTVDNLEVAQFTYLLRENEKVREVLKAVTSRLVLILGRFGERLYVLEAIQDVFRQGATYSPLIFDFEPPEGRDVLDTVKTLALLSRFVLVDLTEARSAPYELDQIASFVIPIQPLFQVPEEEPVLLKDLRRRYHWVLEPYYYDTVESLLESLKGELTTSIEAKAAELRKQ